MNEYSYTYQSTENYCYPGTDVLRNKQGITDETVLADAEREITGLRLLMIRDMQTMGHFDFNRFCSIHRFIFSDIYEWAGGLRRGEFLAKGNSIFAVVNILKKMRLIFLLNFQAKSIYGILRKRNLSSELHFIWEK